MKKIILLTIAIVFSFTLIVFSQVNSISLIKNGLVAHYPFDGDFNDHSGNGFHSTNQSAGFSSGMSGQASTALILNGSNSGARLDNGYPKIFTGSLTVSAWVFFNDDTRAIIFGSYNSANNVNLEKHTSGRLRIWWNDGQRDFYAPKGLISLKKWHLVSFVRDKSKDKFFIYLDGKEVANSAGVGTDVNPAGPFYIGRDSRTGTTTMNGKIDDVQIYNRALSGQEINSLFSSASAIADHSQTGNVKPENNAPVASPVQTNVPKNGLVAHYPFNGDFNDHSGNSYHSTNLGANLTPGLNGQANTALLLNGSNTGARLVNGYPKIFTGSLTISAWVYFNDDSRAIIFGSYDTGNNVNVEKHTNGRLRIWWNNGQRDFYAPTGLITLKKWHLVSFVRDKARDKFFIYLDGKEVANYAGVGTDVNPAGPFYIGRDSRTGTTTMNGKIDDVTLYNRALSSQEINSLFSEILLGDG